MDFDTLERENDQLREELQEQIFCYDSARKEVDDLLNQNKELQEKLDIAVKALKKIEVLKALNLSDKAKVELSFNISHEALEEINELK